MKYSPVVIVFVFLAGAFSFGRTVSDEDIAHALEVALDQRDHPRNPASVQVSSVVTTNKGVCIEYQSKNESGALHSGFAVYKAETKLVFLDNSWIWEKTCLTGRYAQRREGKDATQAVRVALRHQPPTAVAETAFVAPAPAAQGMVPVAAASTVRVATAPPPVAVAAPARVVAPPVAQPVAAAAPVTISTPPASAPVTAAAPAQVSVPAVAQPTATAAQVTVSALTAPARVAVASPPPVATPPVEQAAGAVPLAFPVRALSPSVVVVADKPVSTPPVTRAALVATASLTTDQVAAPAAAESNSTVVHAASPVPVVVPVPTGTIHGATIIDNDGALGERTAGVGVPAADRESLADAARRVRKAKQQ